jgi:hypothetical protein
MRPLLWMYAAAAALLGLIAAHAAITGEPPYLYTRDPAAIHQANPLLGAVSNLGIVLWAAAATVALFTSRQLARIEEARRTSTFLQAAGVLSCWLLLDDLYMLHERVLPDWFGVPQPLVFALYAVVILVLVARFRSVLRTADSRPLALALGFFAVSAAIDQGPAAWHRWDALVLVEDGAKLFGLVGWLAYFGAVSAQALRRYVTSRA